MTETVDGGGHLVDLHGVVHLGPFHHAHDGVVSPPHHTVVARRVQQGCGEKCGRRARVAVVAHQGGQRGRPHQGGVAGEHHHVPVGVDQTFGQSRDPHGHGVAGPELFRLFDEGDGQRRRRVVDQGLGHPFAAMSDHHDDLLGRQLGQRVEDVEDHRSAAETVQGLRTRRAHPCPLAGGEHDSRQRTVGHAV
jgi:hypothetical protein